MKIVSRSYPPFGIEYGYYVNDDISKEFVLHTIDDKTVTCFGGTVMYYHHGKLHRDDDKYAIANDTFMKYYKNGLLHRLENPAVIYYNKIHLSEYWYHGCNLSEIMEIKSTEDYWKAVKLIAFL